MAHPTGSKQIVLRMQWSETNKDVGLLILRIFIGIRLIYGVQDNILHWAEMREFEAFLIQYQFPIPLVSAVVSVYLQALAGILFILGWKTRWASILMVINFTVAIIMVHLGQSFEEMTAVLSMLITSLALLFTGAGRYAFDKN